MAKSKKKKQEDFQKVKLKVGKKLPKGQNVTNTSFKTRSIQVVQQLKTDSSQPSTHRKKNITDLLSKCQHYSISVRHEGVAGLRELVAAFPDLMNSHLSVIIEKSLPLIMDKDNNVRHATLKLFKFIIPNTPTNRIQPFFSIVSAHLCCAMTHIYDEIQHDSLEFFDILLETYPSLVANNSGQLLQNFMEQISRQQNISKNTSNLSLAVRPDSRFAVQKWRSGVLSRVHKLLSALLMWKFSSCQETDQALQCSDYHNLHHVPQQFSTRSEDYWRMPGYCVQSQVAKSLNDSSKGDNLSSFATSIIPLLIQCWIECRASQGNKKQQDNLVHAGSVSVMYHIMGVLYLLWQCVDKEMADSTTEVNKLGQEYQKEFLRHFMDHFPYSVQDPGKHRGHRKYRTAPTISSESLNLSICEVMTFLIEIADDKTSSSLCLSMGEYLASCLDMKSLSLDHSRTLVRILHPFVLVCSNSDVTRTVLERTVERYLQAHPLSTEKRLYLELLTCLFLDTTLHLPGMTSLMDQFFQSLPELLPLVHRDNPKVAALCVRVMRQAACQNCRPLLYSLENSFLVFLDKDEGVFVSSDRTMQRSLLDILYWVPDLKTDLLRRLADTCHHVSVPTSEALYLLDIVHSRFQTLVIEEFEAGVSVVTITAYLSFLLSVMTGGNQSEEDVEMVDEDGGNVDSSQRLVWMCSDTLWRKHTAIVQRTCCHLLQLPDASSLSGVVCSFWKQKLVECVSVHIKSLYSLYWSLCQIRPAEKDLDEAFLDLLATLALSLVVDKVSFSHHMTQLTNQLWECLTECLDAVQGFKMRFFHTANKTLQDCSEETCVSLLTSLVKLLQNQTHNTVHSDLPTQLQNIQHTVSKRFSALLNTQQWKDFLYNSSLLISPCRPSPDCIEET